MEFKSGECYFNSNYYEFIKCKNLCLIEFDINPDYIQYKLEILNDVLLNFSKHFVTFKGLEKQNKIIWLYEIFEHLQEVIKLNKYNRKINLK